VAGPNELGIASETFAAQKDDWVPAAYAPVQRITVTGTQHLTGVVPVGLPWAQRLVLVVVSGTLVIDNASVASAAANRILTQSVADQAVVGPGLAHLLYDPTTGNWRVEDSFGTGTPGAPLTSFQWNSAGTFAGSNMVYTSGGTAKFFVDQANNNFRTETYVTGDFPSYKLYAERSAGGDLSNGDVLGNLQYTGKSGGVLKAFAELKGALDASGNGDLKLRAWDVSGSATVTVLEIAGNKAGFFGVAPVAQQSGAITTALSNLGLVTSPTLGEYSGQIVGFAFVATDESTTSTTYVDLTTADSVTFTLNSTRDLLVEYLSFTYDGVALTDNYSEVFLDGTGQGSSQLQQTQVTVGTIIAHYIVYKLAAVGSGSHTVSVKHKIMTGAGGQVGHWLNRSLKVSILA
jgi:hypothetical protein